MSEDTHQNLGLGFACATVSVLMFGSNFVPVKTYEMGDGMFFQFAMCCGIWTVGVVVQLIQGESAIFRPYAMVGGFLWCTGNVMSTPIIKCIGMALGLLIWGAANLLTGWSMGKFGLLGVNKDDPPNHPALNYIGLALAFIATGVFFFVQPTADDPKPGEAEDPVMPLSTSEGDQYMRLPAENKPAATQNPSGMKKVASKGRLKKVPSWETFSGVNRAVEGEIQVSIREQVNSINNEIDDPLEKYEETQGLLAATSWIDRLPMKSRKLVGIVMAIIAGILFGVNFAPPTHMEDDQNHIDTNGMHYSRHGIDYVYSHFTGILLTSLVYFLIYCVYTRNRPQINHKVALPGWISGVMWGCAQSSWFVANDNLGLTTAYPIITSGPGVVAACWGVFVFNEIRGRKNLTILASAVSLVILSTVLISLSKAK